MQQDYGPIVVYYDFTSCCVQGAFISGTSPLLPTSEKLADADPLFFRSDCASPGKRICTTTKVRPAGSRPSKLLI